MKNNDFFISPRSVHGLGSDLVAGSCSIDKDLALVNESGRWKLVDSRKEQIPLGEAVIRGAALMNIMKAVAKREKLPPPPLTDKEFQILGSFFQCFKCQSINRFMLENQTLISVIRSKYKPNLILYVQNSKILY